MNYFVIALFVLTIILLLPANVTAQQISAVQIESPVIIDGVLDEEVWDNANVITDFIQFEPIYNSPSEFETIVKVVYDDSMIYFSFDCKDPEPEEITAKITKRDGGYLMSDDGFAVLLDTFHDKSNAYFFHVNPIGTQRDGKISDNGKTNDMNWDTSWESACRINSDGWSGEIGIPFEVIKFNTEDTEWGLNVYRQVARKLEHSSWIGNLVEINRVSQAGMLTGLNLSDLSLIPYTIIPYAQYQFQKDRDDTGEVGADVRYNISSNLGLEATLNPDFATIEADVEQVNFTRFELSYPEKRPFFLEGAGNYSTRITQFYSRRIGEIPWGVKLNGKVANWKVNALSTQSDPSTAGAEVEAGVDANYSVFRVNRETSNGSNIGLIGANRNYRDKNSGSLGLVSTLFFTDVLGMTSQFINSYGEADKGTMTYFIRPAYDSQVTHFHIRYSHVGEGVMENMNDTGFITDDDRREIDSNIRRIIWINKYGIDSIIAHVNYNRYWSQKGVLRRWDDTNRFTVKFLKKWEYTTFHEIEFIRYEKDYRNRSLINAFSYDNKKGKTYTFQVTNGRNYDRDFEKIQGSIDIKILEGWDLYYNIAKYWFRPSDPDDNSIIHYARTTYYVNKDLYVKLFYQTKHRLDRGFPDADLNLLRKNLQIVFVWRILPPFGSAQLAYQEGSTLHTDTDENVKTLFCKFSWVL
ncbi:DUF5916 domain-containing protein [Candidatus Latescibacterota bacterium]